MLESRKRQPDAGAVKQLSMSGGRTRFVPHANPCHTQVFRSKVCDSVGLSFTSYLKYSPSKRRKSFQLCRFGPSVAMKVVGGALPRSLLSCNRPPVEISPKPMAPW